jgi:hypothetical protein
MGLRITNIMPLSFFLSLPLMLKWIRRIGNNLGCKCQIMQLLVVV